MASLYQKASVDNGKRIFPRNDVQTTQSSDKLTSNKIVDAVFRTHAPPDTKDVGGQALRVELDVVARTSPDVAHVGQQIVHLIRLARVEVKSVQRQIDPCGLSPSWIQIHHYDDDVQQIVGDLSVDDNLVVVRGMKTQAPVAVQGQVF